MSQTTSKNRTVLLSLHGADSVSAIGEFNNWSTVATPLKQINDDEWELQLPVNVDLERLGLFVIGKGEHSGHVIEYAEQICSRLSERNGVIWRFKPNHMMCAMTAFKTSQHFGASYTSSALSDATFF
jgi:hypothetical protein